MNKEEIHNVAYYLNKFYEAQGKLVETKGQLIFRGQANKDWSIESGAGRRLRNQNEKKDSFINQSDFISYHVNLIANARSFGYGNLEAGTKLSDLEILAEIQHYGGSTCLVDFSTNFLIALWMSTEEKDECHGKVFWLDLGEETNQQNIVYYNQPKKEDKIQRLLTKVNWNFELKKRKIEPCFWLWDPTKLNNRIIMQDSVFLFGLAAFPEKPKDKDARLLFKEIEIQEKDKKNLRYELETIFGINAETVYYDFPGYALEANSCAKPISNKILPKTECLYNAKEYIKKEQYSQAINSLNQAMLCKKNSADSCNRKREKPCLNNCLGEIYFWKGIALKGREEKEEALLNFHIAIQTLNEKFEDIFIKETLANNKLKRTIRHKYLCCRLVKRKNSINKIITKSINKHSVFCKRKSYKEKILLFAQLKDNNDKLIYAQTEKKRIYKLLCESYRKSSVIFYSKFDYIAAERNEQKLAELYQNNKSHIFNKDDENSLNGADAVFALFELSIIRVEFQSETNVIEDCYVKAKQFVDSKATTDNANILFCFLESLYDIIKIGKIDNKRSISYEELQYKFKAIDDLVEKIFKIIEANKDKPEKTICLINYFYWNYSDIIGWVTHIETKSNKNAEEGFITKNAEMIILLAQKAHDAQNKLLNRIFAESRAIPDEIIVFPNRTYNYFEVSGLGKNDKITVKDARGDEVSINIIINEKNNRCVDVSNLDEGEYQVWIKPHNGDSIEKIIKVYKLKEKNK